MSRDLAFSLPEPRDDPPGSSPPPSPHRTLIFRREGGGMTFVVELLCAVEQAQMIARLGASARVPVALAFAGVRCSASILKPGDQVGTYLGISDTWEQITMKNRRTFRMFFVLKETSRLPHLHHTTILRDKQSDHGLIFRPSCSSFATGKGERRPTGQAELQS